MDRSEIATPAKLKQWQYFEKISSFLGENDNISVNLLTDANFEEVLQPLEVIRGQQDGPYTNWTILRWCVVGLIVDEKPDAVSCNWITLLQVENGSVAKHHFEVQNKCEDLGIREMLMKIYMLNGIELRGFFLKKTSKKSTFAFMERIIITFANDIFLELI